MSLLNGGNWMIGLSPDGLLPTDKDALMRLRDEGLERLRRRDFVRLAPGPDGAAEVTAGENMAALSDALFQPVKVLVISKGTHRQGYRSVYFHRGRGGYAEQTLVGDDTHAIALFDTGAAFDAKLLSMLPAAEGPATTFDANESAVLDAVRLSSEGKPPAADTVAPGADAFVASLAVLEYVAVLTLMEIDRADNTMRKNTLTLVVTGTHAWVMAPRDAQRVTVTSLDAAGWRELMSDLAVRFAG
jgi:hypothetical protein